MSKKQPYIPLYIGDWEQDTNELSLTAEGAWLKLIFKMHKARPKSGVYKVSTTALQNMWRVDELIMIGIIDELKQANGHVGICKVDTYDRGFIFTSRRLSHAHEISKTRTNSAQSNGNENEAGATSPDINTYLSNLSEEEVSKVREIVEYLNLKACAKYRTDSKYTIQYIMKRLRENYIVEDFKSVINKKCFDWLEDHKMRQYLRPSTLFGSNFESYLNQQSSISTSTGPKEYTS